MSAANVEALAAQDVLKSSRKGWRLMRNVPSSRHRLVLAAAYPATCPRGRQRAATNRAQRAFLQSAANVEALAAQNALTADRAGREPSAAAAAHACVPAGDDHHLPIHTELSTERALPGLAAGTPTWDA